MNRFGLETEDSGQILVRMNVISCSTEKKQANREEYFIKKEEAKQELQRIIMNERVKHINKKKHDGIKGKHHVYSDEDSDLKMSE